MTKSEEFNIQFYKIVNDCDVTYVIDTKNAISENKRLGFISGLYKNEIKILIETIHLIQLNGAYDPDFLDMSETYEVYGISFNHPYFYVMGTQTIHMNDLKILLEEWYAFLNS